MAPSIVLYLAVLETGSVDINQGNDDGITPLILASFLGHSHVAETLIENGADVSMVTDDGSTALHACAMEGHVAIVELLTKAGADLEAVTSAGRTPLHTATREGKSELMRALIEAGANPHTRMPTGETALHIVAEEGHLDAIRELLRGKADASLDAPCICIQPPSSSGFPGVPLDVAASSGHSGVVRHLVQELGIKGCNPENAGKQALLLAASKRDLDTLAILTGAGAVDTSGSALMCAAEASFKHFLRQRLKEEKGGVEYASINDRISSGLTALVFSIQRCLSQTPRIVRLLINAGADTTSVIRGTNSEGEVQCNGTPLALTTSYLWEKILDNGEPATEEHLQRLEAIRRLLLRAEAVHAVSWLWPSDASFVGHAAEKWPRAAFATT
ncbi:EsV-1-199 [Ectocarpus siliculosus]|uniref:EsV-1-199 n=1 Tax=Ectocarpus siliculosus TaxID=2880 RepID=D7FVU0_ECTSI|nr:EsV-1-199 [Ectocarpus siliculosus]|eukprot:CBJ25460.1 EsV-1-199 [Ectocarpus siliculosus]